MLPRFSVDALNTFVPSYCATSSYIPTSLMFVRMLTCPFSTVPFPTFIRSFPVLWYTVRFPSVTMRLSLTSEDPICNAFTFRSIVKFLIVVFIVSKLIVVFSLATSNEVSTGFVALYPSVVLPLYVTLTGTLVLLVSNL